jgi:hypothetical protein
MPERCRAHRRSAIWTFLKGVGRDVLGSAPLALAVPASPSPVISLFRVGNLQMRLDLDQGGGPRIPPSWVFTKRRNCHVEAGFDALAQPLVHVLLCSGPVVARSASAERNNRMQVRFGQASGTEAPTDRRPLRVRCAPRLDPRRRWPGHSRMNGQIFSSSSLLSAKADLSPTTSP